MEKLKLWWFARNPRDRRALLVLGVVVPVILFWYLVTRPLEDRLKLAHRVLETSRAQALDLQKVAVLGHPVEKQIREIGGEPDQMQIGE